MKIIDNLRTITFIYIRQAIYMHINMTDVKTIISARSPSPYKYL